MICPRCGGGTCVKDSRPGDENSIRRRRACMASRCGFRFTTFEVAVPAAPIVSVDALASKVTKSAGVAAALLKEIVELVSAAATAERLDR